MLIDVEASQQYLNVLKSRLQGLTVEELKALEAEVIQKPKEFKPFLIEAIQQLLKSTI
jgi:hypothetical protein